MTSEVVMERAMQSPLGGLLIRSPRALTTPSRRGIRCELMVSFHIHHSRLSSSCRVRGFHFSSRPVSGTFVNKSCDRDARTLAISFSRCYLH